MFNRPSSGRSTPLPLSSTRVTDPGRHYHRHDARIVPIHRRIASNLVKNPLLAFLLFVLLILSFAWLGGLTQEDERIRLGGGLRVVARDWREGTGGGGLMKGRGKLSGGHKHDQVVLVLTPMKNSIEHIWHYFHLLDTLTYPRHLLHLGVLVSDSTDRTYLRALELADERQFTRRYKGNHYGRIAIFNKDFVPSSGGSADNATAVPGDVGDNIGPARHEFKRQIERRKVLAKSRTWLLNSALVPEVDWVLWIDVDVVEYDADLIQQLLKRGGESGADVVVPNCMWKTYNEMGSYDRNNWAETPESIALKRTLSDEDILIEGYSDDLPTFRLNMASHYPANSTTPETMDLDGVGGCTTMVRADLHRQGAVFPAWPVDHQIETEGFAQIAKKLGGKLVGLPKYYVYHGLYG
ncbi:hypothetical protein T439DRAFT_346382 [Meredithblackwellia eburnea MCA 4105]